MSVNFDTEPNGIALIDRGFVGSDYVSAHVEGLALNTFGFLWPTTGIWVDCCDDVVTVWTEQNQG